MSRFLPALGAVAIRFWVLATASLSITAFVSVACGQSTIEGTAPLPASPPASVMAKRYEIVSKGGVLSTIPPVAVIWLEGDFPPASDAPPRIEIAQKDYLFDPALLVVPVGATVSFPNYDTEYHNVFSYSKAKRFDLGRYLPEERPAPTQTFDQPGTVVLRCDIHEHMRAIIIVVNSPYYTRSNLDGQFALEGIPKGEYVLKAWIDTDTTLTLPVSVDGTSAIEVAF